MHFSFLLQICTISAFRIPLHVQTKIVVELQFKDEAGVQGKGGKGNLG